MQLLTTLRLLTVFIYIFITTRATFAQTKAEKIDALVRQYVSNRQFNGSILVADKGKVILKKGYGMANMEWNIPNTASTKFRLGSITKQFTSMLIMQLVEQGKLKLDGKITDYLPDYPKATGSKITIHHLLTHTSGIPSYTSFPKFFETMSRDPYTPDAFVKKFSDLPLEFEPGSRFSYDNSGYFLLGVIIEKVTGKPYADVLKEAIFDPLAMKDTGYDLAGPIISKRASGYEKRSEGYVNAPYLDMSIPYAAGSLYSTVEDLYHWDQALYTDKLLADSASKTTMYTPFLNHYAYGWGVGNIAVGQLKDSLLLIEHSGGINGFNTLISRIPADKRLVVLLNNTGGAPLSAIRKNILSILYNQPVEPSKKPIAELLRKSVLTESADVSRQKFKIWRGGKAYSLDESEMNTVGYELMSDGKLNEAMTVLALNAEAFPASSNVYDSRGEAYMKLGNKAAAIQDYKKSVELDPKNTNGYIKLKELGVAVAVPNDVLTTADTTTLQTYVGTYQLAPTFSIAITRESDHLYGQATGQPRFELFSESKNKFYLKVVEAKITFVTNEQGGVDQLILHQNGQDMPGKRVR
ncbi:serine hydrolase [Spirosoma validum]|uniref:Serine hydrolase n=1 Tax=Spirosoma validum TaxID=2771355 RepID=A0A927B0V4_9BACT|nr:serine hydrolase [Spirosoma validum]MBD2753469.1 serine hydrolase [Spirosoma validum]